MFKSTCEGGNPRRPADISFVASFVVIALVRYNLIARSITLDNLVPAR